MCRELWAASLHVRILRVSSARGPQSTFDDFGRTLNRSPRCEDPASLLPFAAQQSHRAVEHVRMNVEAPDIEAIPGCERRAVLQRLELRT